MSGSASEKIRLMPPKPGSGAGHAAGFSFPVAVGFCLNYIMGTGFLTLPWAFSQTGYLSFLVMGVILIPAIIAIVMILEAMSRAEKYTELFQKTGDGDYQLRQGVDLDDMDFEGESRLRVKKKKFEIVELCNMFLGPLSQLVYLLILCTYMFGTLWAYGTVFSNAFAHQFPVFGDAYSYYGYIVVFAIFVLPLSCLDLKEQVAVQMALAGGRVLMVIFMVFSVAVSHFWGSMDDFGSDMLSDRTPAFAFHSSGLQHLLPIAVFAYILHHSVPALAEPVAKKTEMSHIFMVTLFCCFLAYSAIALSVSLYFGDKTLSSSNLNWVDYGHNSTGFSWVVKRFISLYITMFPAFDVASAFPLNAITMGNNLFSVIYGSKVHSMEDSRMHKMAFRMLAAVPPLIMAAFESDLGRITDYSGVTGFALAFIFPPLLAYYSHTTLADLGMPVLTVYSKGYTSPRYGALILLFGVAMLIYVPISLMS